MSLPRHKTMHVISDRNDCMTVSFATISMRGSALVGASVIASDGTPPEAPTSGPQRSWDEARVTLHSRGTSLSLGASRREPRPALPALPLFPDVGLADGTLELLGFAEPFPGTIPVHFLRSIPDHGARFLADAMAGRRAASLEYPVRRTPRPGRVTPAAPLVRGTASDREWQYEQVLYMFQEPGAGRTAFRMLQSARPRATQFWTADDPSWGRGGTLPPPAQTRLAWAETQLVFAYRLVRLWSVAWEDETAPPRLQWEPPEVEESGVAPARVQSFYVFEREVPGTSAWDVYYSTDGTSRCRVTGIAHQSGVPRAFFPSLELRIEKEMESPRISIVFLHCGWIFLSFPFMQTCGREAGSPPFGSLLFPPRLQGRRTFIWCG